MRDNASSQSLGLISFASGSLLAAAVLTVALMLGVGYTPRWDFRVTVTWLSLLCGCGILTLLNTIGFAFALRKCPTIWRGHSRRYATAATILGMATFLCSWLVGVFVAPIALLAGPVVTLMVTEYWFLVATDIGWLFALPLNERCMKCGYDLHGLSSGRCPECGRGQPN